MIAMRDVYSLLSAIKSPAEMKALLHDLLTEGERKTIETRWRILYRLAEGKSQRDVRDEAGLGIMTVSRGAAVLRSASKVLRKFLPSRKRT